MSAPPRPGDDVPGAPPPLVSAPQSAASPVPPPVPETPAEAVQPGVAAGRADSLVLPMVLLGCAVVALLRCRRTMATAQRTTQW